MDPVAKSLVGGFRYSVKFVQFFAVAIASVEELVDVRHGLELLAVDGLVVCLQ